MSYGSNVAWSGHIFYKKATLKSYRPVWGMLMRESATGTNRIELYEKQGHFPVGCSPQFTLDLDNVLHIQPVESKFHVRSHQRYEFIILAMSGKYQLATKTLEECQEWVMKLNNMLFGPPEPGVVYEFQVQVLPTYYSDKLNLNGCYVMKISNTDIMLYTANGILPTSFHCSLSSVTKVQCTTVTGQGPKYTILVLQTDSNAKIGEGGYAFATKSGAHIHSTIECRRKLLICPEHQHSDRHKLLIGNALGDIKSTAPMATRKTSTPIPISQDQQWAKKILSLPEITNLRRNSAPDVIQEDIHLSSESSGRSNPPSPVQFVDYESIEIPHYIQLGATGDLISSKDVPKMRLIQPSFDLDSNPPSRQSRSPSPSAHPSNRPPSPARQQSNSPKRSPVLSRWSPDSPRRSPTPPSAARQQSNSPRRSPILSRQSPNFPRRSPTPPSPARQQSNSPRRSPILSRWSPNSPRRSPTPPSPARQQSNSPGRNSDSPRGCPTPPQPPPRHHSPALSPRHTPRDATVPRTASSPKLRKVLPARPPPPKCSRSDGNIKVHNSPPISTSLPNGRSSSIEADFETPDAWIGLSSITTLPKLNEEPISQPTTEEAGYLRVISAHQSKHKDGVIHSAGKTSDTTSSQDIETTAGYLPVLFNISQDYPKLAPKMETIPRRKSRLLRRTNSDDTLQGSIRHKGDIKVYQNPMNTIIPLRRNSLTDDSPDQSIDDVVMSDAIHRFSLTPINSLDDPEDNTIDPYAIVPERRQSGDPYSILFFQKSISSRPPAPLPRNRTAQSSDKSEESEDEYEYVRRVSRYRPKRIRGTYIDRNRLNRDRAIDQEDVHNPGVSQPMTKGGSSNGSPVGKPAPPPRPLWLKGTDQRTT